MVHKLIKEKRKVIMKFFTTLYIFINTRYLLVKITDYTNRIEGVNLLCMVDPVFN